MSLVLSQSKKPVGCWLVWAVLSQITDLLRECHTEKETEREEARARTCDKSGALCQNVNSK